MAINDMALMVAIQAVYPDCVGIGRNPDDSPRPDFSLSADEAKRQAAQAIIDAHDPVFITANKETIFADGTDFVTISVSAPKIGADSITLVITKPNGTTATQLVSMASGVGSVELSTRLYGTYTIALQNPSNRTTDVITMKAV